MRGNKYQIALIVLGIISTLLFGVFFLREVFPEYKIYQDDYVALEEFRSTYTKQPPPAFKMGVKQIVLEREDKGPPVIDRCTSCHIAVQYSHFSPTKIARDINGQIIFDDQGLPVQVENEDYVWARLNKKIEELKASGDTTQAEKYEALKTAEVGEFIYDVTKVLRMHPLMGRETRPFEYHPIEEYGCTSCHSGNGRGLVTDKAHGPVFDGQYETEFKGYVPKFTESDPNNDPNFARIFNFKPGHGLLFQVNPIYVGGLIEAKCVQCHLSSQGLLKGASTTAAIVSERKQSEQAAVENALKSEKSAIISMISLSDQLKNKGFAQTLKELKEKQEDYSLSATQLEQISGQVKYFNQFQANEAALPEAIQKSLVNALGSQDLLDKLLVQLKGSKNPAQSLDEFLNKNRQDPHANGSLFRKMAEIDLQKEINRHISDVETSFVKSVDDPTVMSNIVTDVDRLTSHFNKGQELYISQACYACHRISGFARGGVGPELTNEGKSYPWFVKESLVWPQADLPTSTMPNMRFDHEELEDLTTFLLGQTGYNKSIAETAYKMGIQEWEAGKKLPWEKPVSPAQIQDVRFGMTVFATQGCAACHRLKGFDSNVGFAIEKGKPNFNELFQEKQWFQNLFPETVEGSQIVAALTKYSAEIDKRIVDNVRQGSIIEEIDQKYPGTIESLYTPFKYAFRAKNYETKQALASAKTPQEKENILKSNKDWKARVKKVMKVFIQEYGLGRLIGPRPNWSGVNRSDEWLMEHFRNPQSHIPKSIMPVFPFDDTKFYALTYMLDVLGKRNRDEVLAIWENRGFNPESAVQIFCTQCHGDFLIGNGPVSTWIYPIPKNLRSADFLRNLTRERALNSIIHGVKGTPMPPWGETPSEKPNFDGIPVLNNDQINLIVDWIFSQLPGGQVIRGSQEIPKWNYMPEDVLRELKNEGNLQKFEREVKKNPPYSFNNPYPGETLFAAVDPTMAVQKDDKPSQDVIQVFDILPDPIGPDKYAYYIKKEYYTPNNLAAGKAYFEENCASCHGREADGSGLRAANMQDAKPRMLTNINWLNSRDDLRLLRSIKYGVQGTAMTPWGDLTNSLQRLQLVMFIRSLSEDSKDRTELNEAIYQTFENARLTIEKARIQEYTHLDPLKTEFYQSRQKTEDLKDLYREGKTKQQDVITAYQNELDLQTKVKAYEGVDALYIELRKNVEQQRALFSLMGISLMNSGSDVQFKNFLQIIELMKGLYSNGNLQVQIEPSKLEKIKGLQQEILKYVKTQLDDLKNQKEAAGGKIGSYSKQTDVEALTTEINSLEKLERLLISGFEENMRSIEKQKSILNEINTKLKEIK